MFSILKKYNFQFFFFISLGLVFLSRLLQIIFIKKNSDIYYLYNEPIFINPDSYHFLNKIKEQLLLDTPFFSKLISEDLITSLYLILYFIFNNLHLSELVFLSSPFFVVLLFVASFFFFKNLSDNYLATLTSFSFLFSSVVFFRTSALFFDTDVLNLTFFFLIIFQISFLLKTDLNQKNFYYISICLILTNCLFIFHYPKTIFSIVFTIMIILAFFFNKNKISDKILFLFLFTLSIFISFEGLVFFEKFSDKIQTYKSNKTIIGQEDYLLGSTIS